MKKLTTAEADKRREYQRKWWKNNLSKEAKEKKAKVNSLVKNLEVVKNNGDLLPVINAYYTLRNSTNDGQIKADLNKVFSAILIKNDHDPNHN
jgi:hypothetical protein